MKDTSRPHPAPGRSAPYRKRKASGPVSPTRAARRAHDPSEHQDQMTSSDGAHSLRRHEARARAYTPADGRRSLSKSGGIHSVPPARKHASTDRSARDKSHVVTSGPSPHADAPVPSLRLPLTSGQAHAFAGQQKAESPPPDSVTAFLRSIELPDKPPSGPPLQTSLSLNRPPSLRLPPLSTDSYTRTNGNYYQVSLAYKGYPFTYDLSALSDDPKGTIALLTITKSDPGAYLLVGAHYRRTGRSRAACAVIRSLLDNLDRSGSEKEKGDAPPVTALSDTSTGTLTSPGTPTYPKLTTASAFMGAARRPALLLLAACELDISRERPDDPESADHASTAHELFRAVYGIASDAVVTGTTFPKPNNALGLEFSSNRGCLSMLSSEAVPLTRVKDLEKELNAAHGTQKRLLDKLAVSNNRLARAEDKAHALELDAREMLVQLGASRDENSKLRQRLAESEQRARELAQCAPSAESRVWGKLKDLLFDNLGGMRGE